MDRDRAAEAEAQDHQEEGPQEEVGALAQILAALKQQAADIAGLKASQEEIAEQVLRNEGHSVPAPTGVLRPTARRRDAALDGAHYPLMHFDPESTDGHRIDPHATADMWRPGLVDQCACGEQRWARVVRVVGETDIMDRQQPQLDINNRVVAEPWRFTHHPQTGEQIIPDSLLMTPEKTAHAQECAERARRDPAFVERRREFIARHESELPPQKVLTNDEMAETAAFAGEAQRLSMLADLD